ncbi:MAG: DNA mismatch repair endonuclease MutL [Peptococcaceae bacterium]|nr:DNA mismatch repair endonuclease MutL [Peptococcaceae bacterium]
MPRIILLDEATANQIAAGEVVERPASVVKELVENSLDAGATRVGVEIRGGGLDEIRVVDNGCGMDETDSVTAFQRHATSKISSISDLEEISSLGFRGEALPSIAAVSRTVLVTRPPEAFSGTRLEVQGGRILSSSPAGCPPGTSITVKELFFNTPARLKHMKSKSAEAGQVSDVVLRLALARPGVSFRLLIDGRAGLNTPGNGVLLDAVAAVYGSGIAGGMLILENAEENITVGGLISPPSVSRSSKRHITVIINGRYVTNHLVGAAVLEGYGTLMPRGRFPLAVVVLNMDPRLLDINVHPSKMVVRVTGEDRLFNLVRRTVAAALRTDRIIPAFTLAPGGEKYTGGGLPAGSHDGPIQREESVSEAVLRYPAPAAVEKPPSGEGPGTFSAPGEGSLEARDNSLLDTAYPIGFLPPAYILAGSGKGLLVIDQHAAHERILYEKFLALLNRNRVESQILLVPAVVQLSPREYQTAEENLELLASLGINASGLGDGSLLVREIPAGLSEIPVEELVRDLLESLAGPGGPLSREETIKKMSASAACRAAVKSGTRSSPEEAWAVIKGLREADVPYACPHGRPTMVSITEQELKARFKRT